MIPRGRRAEVSLARLRRLGLWPWGALAVMLLAVAAFCLHETAGTTFWVDEWSWILNRRSGGLSTFLTPHNEHLSLVPVAIYRVLFATAGLRDYGPYRVVVTALHLICITLVFLYIRVRVGDYLALLAAALLLLFGPGWQDFLWPFQLAWLIALAAGIGALLMLDRGSRRGDIGACLLLALSLASAGPSLGIACGLLFEVSARRRPRNLWIVLAPLALYGLWWLTYQHSTLTRHAVVLTPQFVMREAAGALSALVGLGNDTSDSFLDWGPPLIVAATALLVWRRRWLGRLPRRAVTLLVIVLSLWTIIALARANGLGFIANGNDSRYLYVSVVLIVLLIAELSRGVRVGALGGAAVGAIVAVVMLSNIGPLRDGARNLQEQARVTKAQLSALDLTRMIVSPSFRPAGIPFGIVPAGAYFAAERALGWPALSAAQIAAGRNEVRLGVDAELIAIHNVALRPAGAHALTGRASPPSVDSSQGSFVVLNGSCVRYQPVPFVSAGASPSVAVTVPSSGLAIKLSGSPATLLLRRFSTVFQTLGTLSPSKPVMLQIAADLAPQPWHLQIVGGGAASICALG